MRKRISVVLNFQGLHRWPHAPDEVAFLRNLHRHVFHVTVKAEVEGSDRDIEYFMLRARAVEVVRTLGPVYHRNQPDLVLLKSQSCEMMAGSILVALRKSHPTVYSVTVREDEENSATTIIDVGE